jgi:hypothetical protein
VRNEKVLHRAKERRNILHTIKRRNADWIGHILRTNCLLNYVIGEKIEGTRRRGRRRTQILDNLKNTKYILNSKKSTIYHCVKLALEMAMGQS